MSNWPLKDWLCLGFSLNSTRLLVFLKKRLETSLKKEKSLNNNKLYIMFDPESTKEKYIKKKGFGMFSLIKENTNKIKNN